MEENKDTNGRSKLLLSTKGGEVAEPDNFYRYNHGIKEYQKVKVEQVVDHCGLSFMIHKTSGQTEYYMASELTTGVPLGGSCIEEKGMIKMLVSLEEDLLDAFYDMLTNAPLSPRFRVNEALIPKKVKIDLSKLNNKHYD